MSNITDSQITALDAAASFWQQNADQQAAAAIEAAGISAAGAKAAAEIMGKYYEKGIEYQEQMWKEIQSYNTPYTDAGEWAVKQLKTKISEFDDSPDAYVESPYFDWLQTESINALDKSASSTGKLESGAQQKAVMEYGKNLASTDYDSWLSRYYQSLSPYQTMASEGRAAAGQLSSAGQSNANAVSNLYGMEGSAYGDAEQSAANATASGVLGASAAESTYLNEMGQAMIDAGDIRASGYVNSANQDAATQNSLYELAGTALPYAIEAAPGVYNSVKDWYGNQNFSSEKPLLTETDTGGYNNSGEYIGW